MKIIIILYSYWGLSCSQAQWCARDIKPRQLKIRYWHQCIRADERVRVRDIRTVETPWKRWHWTTWRLRCFLIWLRLSVWEVQFKVKGLFSYHHYSWILPINYDSTPKDAVKIEISWKNTKKIFAFLEENYTPFSILTSSTP